MIQQWLSDYFLQDSARSGRPVTIYKAMNLKIDTVLPYPPALAHPYLLAFLPPLQALLLYAPPHLDKPEEPKKKFNFKASSSSAQTTEEVYLFDFAHSAWRTQETKGKFPTRRENAGVACMGGCLMVFGGKQTAPSKPVNDLYALNLGSWQWKKLFTMEAPPAHPAPLAVAISDSKLLVVGRDLWVFSGRDVKWELNKDDLPGGLWEKIEGDMPFEPKCGGFLDEELLIFGWDGGLKAAALLVQAKTATLLGVEGSQLAKMKGESVEVCLTSQGLGLLVDKNSFVSLARSETGVLAMDVETRADVSFDRIVGAEVDKLRINMGITAKKELGTVTIHIADPQPPEQEQQEEEEEEDLPNTARQLEGSSETHQSSLMDRQSEVSLPPPSPTQQALSAPILSHLSPLLAREWLRRRILEEKGQLLEDSIKKAERMVLALCSYGGEEEKRAHITKVRKLREVLYGVFNRESYFRKEMEERPGENQLRQQALADEGAHQP